MHIPTLTGVDEVLVGDAWVVDIVDGSGEERCKSLEVCEHGVKRRRQQQHVYGLRDVSRMTAVVVRNLQVVVFQRQQEGQELFGRNVERLKQVTILKKRPFSRDA